jgi:hypothetical protein
MRHSACPRTRPAHPGCAGGRTHAEKAPWYDEHFAERVFARAFAAFDNGARSLARSVHGHQAADGDQPAGDEQPRRQRARARDAKQRHDEAFRQQSLLLQESGSANSDFYTYRYLASQGFPARLQLPAPAADGLHPGAPGQDRPRELPDPPAFPRPRRVRPVQPHLSRRQPVPSSRVRCSPSRATTRSPWAPACHRSRAYLPGLRLWPLPQSARRRPLRVVQCAAGRRQRGAEPLPHRERLDRRAERITANEEERVRQGYEMQTTIQFAEQDGKLQRLDTSLPTAGTVLTLQYGAGCHRLAHELRLAPAQGKKHPRLHDQPGHRPLGRRCRRERRSGPGRAARPHASRSASFPMSRTAATC